MPSSSIDPNLASLVVMIVVEGLGFFVPRRTISTTWRRTILRSKSWQSLKQPQLPAKCCSQHTKQRHDHCVHYCFHLLFMPQGSVGRSTRWTDWSCLPHLSSQPVSSYQQSSPPPPWSQVQILLIPHTCLKQTLLSSIHFRSNQTSNSDPKAFQRTSQFPQNKPTHHNGSTRLFLHRHARPARLLLHRHAQCVSPQRSPLSPGESSLLTYFRCRVNARKNGPEDVLNDMPSRC